MANPGALQEYSAAKIALQTSANTAKQAKKKKKRERFKKRLTINIMRHFSILAKRFREDFVTSSA